jgi:hypothetical protein
MVLFYLKYFCLQVKFQLAFSLSTKKSSVLKITIILFWQDILRVFKPLTLHLFPHTPQAIPHTIILAFYIPSSTASATISSTDIHEQLNSLGYGYGYG